VAVDEIAAVLRDAGHSVVTASPSYPLTLGLRFNGRWLAGIAQDARGLRTDALEDRTRAMVRRGERLSGRARPASADPFTSRVAAWFGDYDVLITPTLTRSPYPVGTWDGKGWISTMLSVANWIYTPPWNMAGLPAASVPFGLDDEGLPIGIQLTAGAESVLLGLASQIERLRPWPRVAPVADAAAAR
jgi:amidase